jgi:NhaA family Na+:H+ antiporter
VAFVILPLFAMANTCLTLDSGWLNGITENNSIGIILGLLIGKPVGIFLFAFLGSMLGACVLPSDLNWKHIIGAGMLGGIGFTMSIFITLLAFHEPVHIDEAKIAILVASILSGLVGFLMLRKQLKLPV